MDVRVGEFVRALLLARLVAIFCLLSAIANPTLQSPAVRRSGSVSDVLSVALESLSSRGGPAVEGREGVCVCLCVFVYVWR